jgi:hypothetical protein
MDLTVKTLDLLFRRISPERVISDICSGRIDSAQRPGAYRKLFLSQAEDRLHGYSIEEQENIFQYFSQIARNGGAADDLPPFYLLADFGEQCLKVGDRGPVCRFEKTLVWRDAYLLLGQDTITTALLAYRPGRSGGLPGFAWPAVIPADDQILDSVLSDLAENHMHLGAGGSTFAISWCCAMNHPETILENRAWLNELLDSHTGRGAADNVWTMERRLLYAAFLRCSLFEKLQGLHEAQKADEEDHPLTLGQFHLGYGLKESECRKLERRISSLRYCYGLRTGLPNGGTACLDYALTVRLRREAETDVRLLAAERFFLFSCFRACAQGSFSPQTQWSFYCYLLLKAQARSQLIQINRQVGFHNFHDYDERKNRLWGSRPEYVYEGYRQALNGNLRERRISRLEARVCPKSTGRQTLSTLYEIDRAKLFFDARTRGERSGVVSWRADEQMENKAEGEPHFFVLHFPKQKDADAGKPRPFCRHEAYRSAVSQTATEFAKTLSNSDYLCQRVLGIDACSNELVCRPEVFGNAFRFLRYFSVTDFRRWPSAAETPRLRFTFHVGEDFLDIADGLRATDEAIHFLDLQRGDRLGHAIALGVDPETHYSIKDRTVILSKQELLDNLVWLCFRSVELDVEIGLLLKSKLQSRAWALLEEIYPAQGTLEEYYHSMLLRGDEPACYKTGRFQPCAPKSAYDFYQLNQRRDLRQRLEQVRRQDAAVTFYFLYHYGIQAKRIGAERTTFKVSPEYVCLMRQMQRAMGELIDRLGIRVECNPSSNVLIGTFQQYQKHPIFWFNHGGLRGMEKGMRLHVSVNTDDPGVFDTSLTFEYTLIAAALRERTDETGRRLYTDREIEDYLRALVRMGQEQSFARPAAPCNKLSDGFYTQI